MSADTSMSSYVARGFTFLEAAERSIDSGERDELNALNDAFHITDTEVLSSHVRKAVNALRMAAHGDRRELRERLARHCAAWFEVQQ